MTTGAKIVKKKQKLWPLLGKLELLYSYSDRRLYDHFRRGVLLGLSPLTSKGVEARIEGEPTCFVGPVPDVAHDYLKPKMSDEVRVELAGNSPVSSAIWLQKVGRKHVVLRADISGAWASIFFKVII